VMTLFSATPQRPTAEAGAAFATPTILDFASVLGISLLMRVPWPNATPAAISFGAAGISGIIYSAIVTRRMRFQNSYEPELEDWIFYVAMRVVAFLSLAVSGLFTLSRPSGALFGVAAAAVILLFSGIHNAWDAVTFHIFVTRDKPPTKPLN